MITSCRRKNGWSKKADMSGLENRVRETRQAVRAAKDAYTEAISSRSASQREVNSLLQRKHAWSPQDLERFTSLYRSDHANEQAEREASESLSTAERQAEEAAAKLSRSILARYHEEQIWSDKIRRASTWGTWGLMGINVLLFLVFQIGVEPWRRRRLVKGFEEKVQEALEREGALGRAAMAMQIEEAGRGNSEVPISVASEVVNMEKGGLVGVGPEVDEARPDTQGEKAIEKVMAEEIPGIVPVSATDAEVPPATAPGRYKKMLEDLFSERQVILSQKDLTNIALGGAAAGAAFAGIVLAILRPR